MKTKFLLFMTAFMMILSSQAQTVITVDNSVGADADYNDLQSAITNAADNSIIYVHASEINYGDITVNKPLTIIGYSHSDSDKETMVDYVTLSNSASNVRFTGIHFTNNFVIDNDDTLITDLVLENNFFDNTIFFGGNAIADDVIIRGNIIYDIGTNSATNTKYTNTIISNNIFYNNLYVFYHESVQVHNNIFLNEGIITNIDEETGDLEVQDCIFYASVNSIYDPNRDGVVFNNCLTYNDLNSVAALVGNANIPDSDPLFVNATDDVFDALTDDYTLQATSPALGAGVDGDDIGLYSTNTNFTFNNLGFTAGIPIVTITSITSQIAPGGDLEVTIQSNSN